MEKERRGFVALSDTPAAGRVRDCERSDLVANMAAMLRGVPGLLTKKTLSLSPSPSPSSLVDSPKSSAPAATDLASTSVGACFMSGKTLLKPLTCATDPLRLANVRSFVTFAVKNCAYSTSLSVLAECMCESMDGSSTVISSSAEWCCRVADR